MSTLQFYFSIKLNRSRNFSEQLSTIISVLKKSIKLQLKYIYLYHGYKPVIKGWNLLLLLRWTTTVYIVLIIVHRLWKIISLWFTGIIIVYLMRNAAQLRSLKISLNEKVYSITKNIKSCIQTVIDVGRIKNITQEMRTKFTIKQRL